MVGSGPRWLSIPTRTAWILASTFILGGLVAYAPYLSSGFSADDFILLSMIEGTVPFNPWLGLWAVDVDQCRGFTQLWWADMAPGGAFLRPVASWVLIALYETFGRNAVPFHVTSAIIHSLVAFTAFLLLRRLSGRDIPALLAALLFLICEDHAMTVGWIATVTDLLCAVFLNLALLSHVVARQERRRWLFAISLLLFLIAFGCKETAAVYPVIVGLYELFFADRLHTWHGHMGLPARMRRVFRTWWAWAIPLVVFSAYMALYRSVLPPITTMTYVDPLSQPGRYLAEAIPKLSVFFLALLSQFLPSIVLMVPGALDIAFGLGIVLTLLLVWTLLPFRDQPTLWFSLSAFVVALLPGLATEPGERLLYYPSVFGFFPIAWLILQIPKLRRRFLPEIPAGIHVLGPIVGWYLLISTLVLPAVLLFVAPSIWMPSMALPEITVVQSLPLIDSTVHEHVIYLNTNSSYNTFYLPDIYRYHRGEYVDLRVLSSFNGRVEARADPPDTIVVRTTDRGWLSNLFAKIIRSDPNFGVGDIYYAETFTARILQVTPDEHDVLEVEFVFEMPLHDRSVVLLSWTGEAYQRWQPTERWQLLNETVSPYSF